MAIIAGYSSLQTAVGDYLARGDLSTFIPNFIQNWEESFLREPKNFGRWMETDLDVTISSSVAAVPADYLGLKYAYVDGSPSSRLDRRSLNQVLGEFPRGGDTGLPLRITRGGSNFLFGPEPDSDYTIKGWYWAKPTLIRNFAADAAAHYVIVNTPDVALFGALLQATPFIKDDDRIAIWQTMHDRALQSYRNLQREEDQSGSPSQEILA